MTVWGLTLGSLAPPAPFVTHPVHPPPPPHEILKLANGRSQDTLAIALQPAVNLIS